MRNGKTPKPKKPIYKRIWFWIVVVMLLSLVARLEAEEKIRIKILLQNLRQPLNLLAILMLHLALLKNQNLDGHKKFMILSFQQLQTLTMMEQWLKVAVHLMLILKEKLVNQLQLLNLALEIKL